MTVVVPMKLFVVVMVEEAVEAEALQQWHVKKKNKNAKENNYVVYTWKNRFQFEKEKNLFFFWY